MTEYFDCGQLPAAVMSPRVSGGVLKWYEGDTFELLLHLELTDHNGEPMMLLETDRLRFRFLDKSRRCVYEAEFTDVAENTVVLAVTEEVTKLFPKGEYTYDAVYEGFGRRTIAHDAPILVE